MKKIIFHIDVNSAYLSWTAIKLLRDGSNTDLRKIPAIVGGDMSKRHGVVLAKSMSAARYGIRTGEPITDALRKCASLTIVPPEHHYYSVCSHQLLDLLHHYTPSISQYSIDECFAEYVPVPGDNGDPVKAAHIIKDVIRNKLGFTVNVGISTNRLLAKMASDFEKPDKVHTLFPEEIPVKMWPLPVKDLFMVGRSSASKLELLGIKTIGDLAKMDPTLIEAHLKSHGRTIWEYANGIESVHIDDRTKTDTSNKGIGNSTTLSTDVTTEEAAGKVLLELSESVTGRLRKAGFLAGMVSVEIRYSTFTNVSHQMQLVSPSQATQVIYEAALRLFTNSEWHTVRLLGIRTSKLSDCQVRQMNLFDYVKNDKQEKLDQALDSIRQKYGSKAVMRGSFLEEKRPPKATLMINLQFIPAHAHVCGDGFSNSVLTS
ncbi:MAG: DNA polymerase IV [Coprococcus sp.]